MGVREDKINWINPTPNFVKHISNVEELRKFRQKFTGDENKVILFVGRLVERKGVEYLIKSLAEIKTQKFHLMIAGNGGLLDDLVNLTNSLNLQDKVTFFVSPTQEDLGKLYDTSDVFVCPSIIDSKGETEGLGLVIPEAMESGLPVIATSVGGIVDVVKNEENGILINQKDSKAITTAIDRLLTDKELTEKIVNNSKKTILEFDPIKISEKHFILFQNLLKN
ncbi:MAG: glycosyltransferase family 4 protein [Bacteroidetes bacterium]|nr:glycosyltransferase family 4 protein [Bacteroidota bacterium]